MSEKILVPTLGESVTEATVSKWLKNKGEKVSADEPIVELETDKVNVEVPAPSNGVLERISVQEGETVNVGALLGMINGSEKEVLKNGEIGVVEVKGPNVFKGYWKQPEKTKSEFREDGFFITGDMGYLDKDQYLTIVGRNKDLIITGGLNVYPKEIETIIDTHNDVEESAVVGVLHPDFGEGIIAIIVEKRGHTVNLQSLNETLGKNLASFKLPKKFHIIKELPRNSMGKVQKNILRNTYKDEFRATNE